MQVALAKSPCWGSLHSRTLPLVSPAGPPPSTFFICKSYTLYMKVRPFRVPNWPPRHPITAGRPIDASDSRDAPTKTPQTVVTVARGSKPIAARHIAQSRAGRLRFPPVTVAFCRKVTERVKHQPALHLLTQKRTIMQICETRQAFLQNNPKNLPPSSSPLTRPRGRRRRRRAPASLHASPLQPTTMASFSVSFSITSTQIAP